jgi:HD superfamily phosphohydrolase
MHAKKLRDAVHRDIRFDPPLVAAMDTPQMQRLRGIRQLGAAYYVYPSAHHMRFEHGLGTYWMARRIMDEIEAGGAGNVFSPTEREAVHLAALVHDVTHIPFGHTFEDERRLLDRHDRSRLRYRYLIGEGALGELLRSSEAGRLAMRILSPDQEMPPERLYLREIVSGTICADLLDYLKRDNYFCGLCYEFDERIFQYFRIADGRLALDMEQDGFFRRDALSEVTNLLRIRYVLSERVYYHHAKIAAGVMISKAVERALAAGLAERDLCALTDGGLIYRLRERFSGDAALAELIDDFELRRLFKRCYVVSRQVGEEQVQSIVRRYHLNEGGARDEAERRIADALGAAPHRVAVYCAPAGMALKEADVPVIVPRRTGGTELTLLSALNSDEIQVLKRQHHALWKMFVFLSPRLSDRLSEAGRICEQVLGYPNELPVERRGPEARS